MKQTKARNIQVCSVCNNEIKVDEDYLAGPYMSLCKICGPKYKNGEIVYSRKSQKYVNINESKRKCISCNDIGVVFYEGKSSCLDHKGDLFGNTPWDSDRNE